MGVYTEGSDFIFWILWYIMILQFQREGLYFWDLMVYYDFTISFRDYTL